MHGKWFYYKNHWFYYKNTFIVAIQFNFPDEMHCDLIELYCKWFYYRGIVNDITVEFALKMIPIGKQTKVFSYKKVIFDDLTIKCICKWFLP